MIRPASSTASIRWSSTAPVSVSTSTTATCAPNGNVGCEAWKSTSALSSPSWPWDVQLEARSPQLSAGSGAPVTWKRPWSTSSTMSSGAASSSAAARRLPISTTSSDAWPAATPPIWVDFDPYVPVPRGTMSVSPLLTVIFSTGIPSRSDGDLRERRLVALAL